MLLLCGFFLLFAICLCCAVLFTILHFFTHYTISLLALVPIAFCILFYFLLCTALRLRSVPFRAGQLNSTTFDLRMFDQLLLLLLLLPGDVIVCASGCG